MLFISHLRIRRKNVSIVKVYSIICREILAKCNYVFILILLHEFNNHNANDHETVHSGADSPEVVNRYINFQ